MLFWNKICGLTAIFSISVFSCSAQKANLTLQTIGNKLILCNLAIDSSESVKNFFKSRPSAYLIPKDYYTLHMGIICKKELAFEKLTKIPLRLRVGSLQQCNTLEGKR